MQWLEADLADVDRCVTPWLFIGMHRPMYVPYPHKSNRIVGRHLQDILEDLFLEREVDMVMTGHVHLYARTCSVRRDHCRKDDDGGITHVTVGEPTYSCLFQACLSATDELALLSGTVRKQHALDPHVTYLVEGQVGLVASVSILPRCFIYQ